MIATARHTGGGSPEEEFQRLLHELRASAGDQTYTLLARKTSTSASTLHEIFWGKRFPRWETIEQLLRALDASPFQAEQIRRAWEKANRAREQRRASPARPLARAGQGVPPGTVVINGEGSTAYVSSAAGPGGGSPPDGPPALIPDMDGHALKPDPLQATTFGELTELMREFRAWAGHPSSRDLANRSGGEFSHATISKLLSGQPGAKPPLKLGYIRGFIRACGGDEEDLKRWITAWRRIDQGTAATHARYVNNVVAMKPSAEPAS